MAKVIRIAHVAVVGHSVEAILPFWRDGLGLELSQVEDVPDEGAKIAFLPVGESEVELVEPTLRDSGLARFLEKRGSGLHHICLEVDDIEGMLAQLKQEGVELINEAPLPGKGAIRYAFIHPRSAGGALVELYEHNRVLE